MAVMRHDFATAAALDAALAEFVAAKLAEAIEQRGQATLLVSGGNTPKGFFERLSHQPLRWSQVIVTLADERWLPVSHEDSNERSVRQQLLQNAASSASFVPLHDGAPSAAAGAASAALSLARLPRPFDVVILGMGGDGHTASLFPGAAQGLTQCEEGVACVAVPAPAAPNVPVERISLTAAALTDCHHLILHVTGQVKRDLLQLALQLGPVSALPVRLALQQDKVPCQIFWAP